MKFFNTFNIVRIVVAIVIITFMLILIRNFDDTDNLKFFKLRMFVENGAIAITVAIITIIILKIKKINVF